MSEALAASSNKPRTILPGVLPAAGLVVATSVAGGITAGLVTANRRPVWHYASIGAGITVGLGIGWLGGHFIMKRALAKFAAQLKAEEEEELRRQKEETARRGGVAA